MGQGPGAIQEHDIARQAGDKEPVQEGDQATAPLVGALPVPAAEAAVETQPGDKAAGHLQNDGNHPAGHGGTA